MPQPKISEKPPLFLNAAVTLAFAAALFFLLTGGLLFAHLGIVSDFSKGQNLRFMRISLLSFATVLFAARFGFASCFENLSVVRGFRRLTEMSLKKTLPIVYVIYCTILLFVTLFAHYMLGTRAFDLGIFAQSLWTTSNGHFLYSSLKEGICLLGDHFSPLLALLVPFYAAWPDPQLLIILQVLVSATSFFLIAKIADEKLRDRILVWFFIIIYFFYLPTRSALHEDFHPEVLVEPLILLAFISLEKRKLLPFLFCLPFIAAAKENMLGITCMFGLYAAFVRKYRFAGMSVAAASVIFFFLEVKWLVPLLSGKPYFYGAVYSQLLSPLSFAKIFIQPDSLEYGAKIFGPFLFLPLFHLPTFALTLPILLQNILAANPVARSLGYHYTTGLTPFVFISSIYGLAEVLKRFPKINGHKYFLGLLLLFMSLLQSGTSEYYAFWQNYKQERVHREHFALLREKLAAIPNQYSVLTHNNLVPRLSNRMHIYQFDYASGSDKTLEAQKRNVDYVILDEHFWEPNSLPASEILNRFQQTAYRVEFQQDGFVILKKSPEAA